MTYKYPCRCGYDGGPGEHLCHRCQENPGKTRFYLPSMKFSIAGAQLKFSVQETFGCDPCWEIFQKLTKVAGIHNGKIPCVRCKLPLSFGIPDPEIDGRISRTWFHTESQNVRCESSDGTLAEPTTDTEITND